MVDERFNEGGSIADYFVDLMNRKLRGFFNNPVGDHRPFYTPAAGILGPKVMLINEMSGSGGDMLPYMFRELNMDGGYITAPRGGFYDLQGKWDVENVGIAPDMEVEETPLSTKDGDAQLVRGVVEALKLLDASDVRIVPEPPPPVRVRRPQ